MSIPDQPLVEKSVNLAMPSVVVPEESSDHTTHVFLVSSDSHESKSDPPRSCSGESFSYSCKAWGQSYDTPTK